MPSGNPWDRLTSTTSVARRVGVQWVEWLGSNPAAPAELLFRLLDLGQVHFLRRKDLPEGFLDAALVHPSRRVRGYVMEMGGLTEAQWERLIAATPEAGLRRYAEEDLALTRQRRASRGVDMAPSAGAVPPSTPDEIAALAAEVPDIDPDGQTIALWWIGALHEDAEAMRQLARSPKLLVRRSVARARHLPPDVVALLAGDEDRAVRLFLVESCEDAPPELLLEVAAWWDGSFSFPGRPRNHPNFPREGLLRLADDPNPRLRALAIDDPAATPADVDRLSRDPDPGVRMSAAEDPRLSPEAAARLAAEPHQGVQWRAMANPALPPETLVGLLLDEKSADKAVRNPTIPVEVMHHLLTLGAAHLTKG